MSTQLPWWAAVPTVVLALSLSACSLKRSIIHNIHEVVPGTVVRSAQLSASGLTELIERHQLRSVLNLRGPSTEAWYERERATAAGAKVEHIDFELSSEREVGLEQADALIELMKRARKPMLIHCWAGADRTGLASALYLYAIEDQPARRAASALSIRYYHLPFTSAGAMDRSFDAFVTARSPLKLKQ